MALLDLMTEAARTMTQPWVLAVGHLDHGQRPESAEEARFVAAQAAECGLPFFTERWRRARPQAAPGRFPRMRCARRATTASGAGRPRLAPRRSCWRTRR